MRNPNSKYFKISIWLIGGGKIIKETTTETIDELNYWILEKFKDSINTPSFSSQILEFDNCIIKFSDISAIDIEEKIEPER